MSSRLNREAFERLIAENIAWTEAQPRSLERDHLVAILRDSARLYYEVEPAVDARDKTIAERDAEIARLTKDRDAVRAIYKQICDIAPEQHDDHNVISRLLAKLGQALGF